MSTIFVHIYGPSREHTWYKIPPRYFTTDELAILPSLQVHAYSILYDTDWNTVIEKYRIVNTPEGSRYTPERVLSVTPSEDRLIASFIMDDRWEQFVLRVEPSADSLLGNPVYTLTYKTALKSL